ncbi:MAG: prmC 2 [Frankiales bacterium]|nr:prmC 2 [Frankiales bacterium]
MSACRESVLGYSSTTPSKGNFVLSDDLLQLAPLSDSAAVRQLIAAGVPAAEARADVVALAAHARRVGRPGEFERLIACRAERVPLSHLLGSTTFRGITLRVGPGVFSPQPETSSMVQWAVDRLRTQPAPLVVDLCTGSGTVALALANELSSATVHAVERDSQAFAWAQRNAEERARAGDTPVLLHLGDAGSCLPDLDGQLDMVISNPPYVALHEAHVPDVEVVKHDPGIALWAGADGLDVVRDVERTAARLLKPGGLVVVEHSDRQGATAPAVFTATGAWEDVQDHVDHEGLDRFVTARRIA